MLQALAFRPGLKNFNLCRSISQRIWLYPAIWTSAHMPDFGQCDLKIWNIIFFSKVLEKCTGRTYKLGSGFVSCYEKYGTKM